MVFNDNESQFLIAYIARDKECASWDTAKKSVRMQRLLTDLAGVATDPAKPKKRRTVEAMLYKMRQNPAQQELRREKERASNATTNQVHNKDGPAKRASNAITNLKVREATAVAREVYHDHLAASGAVMRNTTEVRVSRPANVDVEV